MIETPPSSDGQVCSREGLAVAHLLYSSGVGSQKGESRSCIQKRAVNFHIDIVVSLLGSLQTEVHSCRSNPYGYYQCYTNGSWSKICRDRFDLLLLSPNRYEALVTAHKYVIVEYYLAIYLFSYLLTDLFIHFNIYYLLIYLDI